MWRVLHLSLLASLGLTPAAAHDAPARVAVQIHVREQGPLLRALVRIPLEAVRDVDFPATPEGYLDVEALSPRLKGLARTWVADPLVIFANGAPAGAPRITAVRLAIEADRSFATFDSAEAGLRMPMPRSEERLIWRQLFLDTALEYTIPAGAEVTVQPGYASLGEEVTVFLEGGERLLVLNGAEEAPSPLHPRLGSALWRFFQDGVRHILSGTDHLLFLLCLVIPEPRLRRLVWVITAFTAAHSVSLTAVVLGWAPDGMWFPPLVEWGIALSIVLLALAGILRERGGASPWIAFAFGLLHGFGFAFGLRESLQFAGSHVAGALGAFNLGVEAGQVAVLAVLAPALRWGYARVADRRVAQIVLGTLAAHAGWHWMEQRWEILTRHPLPAWSAAGGVLLLQWILAGMALWGMVWLIRRRR